MLKPHRGRFYIATVALLIGSGIGLSFPQIARFAIDEGLSAGNSEMLDRIALVFLALVTAQAGLTWVRHYLMSWLGERVVADLRRQVFDRILTLPPAWFQERRTGEVVGRLASDVTVVEGIVGSELSIALRNTVQLFGGVILLFISNAKLTAIMLLIIPPLSVGVVLFGRMIRKMSRAVQDRLAEASAQVDETVAAIETVQSFTREETESKSYASDVEAAFQQALSLTRWRASFFSTATLAGLVAVGGILWVGGRAVLRAEIDGGELMAFLLYTLMVATSLGSLAGLWGNLQRAAGATERLFGIVDTVPDIRDVDTPTPLPAGRGTVSFDDVSFRYASRPDHPVLQGVSLDVAPGEVVALVGTSGAGKSTLTALVQRFYDVNEGTVLFEGVDVRQLRLADLRGAVSIVAQEPVLMSGSVRDNIAYGRLDASDDEIRQAARDAHAHDFVSDFPDGYDTVVGERGVKLSGGQKQRVAIARAVLADPRVLILDEATSNLDAESEHLVQAALAKLMKGRTTIVVAHRLSTVRDADRIVVLDKGRVIEQGTHAALMDHDGAYKRLVEHQLVQDTDDATSAAEPAAPPAA
jgi:ABC transporter fused permease/ATP-binding protein